MRCHGYGENKENKENKRNQEKRRNEKKSLRFFFFFFLFFFILPPVHTDGTSHLPLPCKVAAAAASLSLSFHISPCISFALGVYSSSSFLLPFFLDKKMRLMSTRLFGFGSDIRTVKCITRLIFIVRTSVCQQIPMEQSSFKRNFNQVLNQWIIIYQ